jgi:hypothetical protein
LLIDSKQDTPTLTTRTAIATSASKVAEVSFAILPVPTIPFSQLLLSSVTISRSTDIVPTTAYATITNQPSEMSKATAQQTDTKPVLIAAIVGAVIGTLALIAFGVLLFSCVRGRKHKNIYKAPVYVSPYNINDNVSQKPRASLGAKCRGICDDVQQLDSREVQTPRRLRDEVFGFAELPAEPLAEPVVERRW